ncbi:MAG: phage Gp19/Gp15/Gp42 family protein [Ruminococcus sp.]
MAAEYATIEDVIKLGRKLTAEEQEKAAVLLPVACAKLSTACKKYGKDLDIMIADEPDVELVAKDIIVRATLRAVDTIADSSPATSQASQSAMGYSVSMTYLNAGQQLYFLRNELKELGVMRQRYGAMEVYDV